MLKENKNDIVKIIMKNKSVIFDRTAMSTCNESSDGIVFQLNNGMVITCEDLDIPQPVKTKIKLVIDKMPKGSVVINLDNFQNPVQLIQNELKENSLHDFL